MNIKRGDLVKDAYGNRGVVVRIDVANAADEDDGAIYVWQLDRVGYGADNCEHYSYQNWSEHLTVLENT